MGGAVTLTEVLTPRIIGFDAGVALARTALADFFSSGGDRTHAIKTLAAFGTNWAGGLRPEDCGAFIAALKQPGVLRFVSVQYADGTVALRPADAAGWIENDGRRPAGEVEVRVGTGEGDDWDWCVDDSCCWDWSVGHPDPITHFRPVA